MKSIKIFLILIIALIPSLIFTYFYFFWNSNEYEVKFNENLLYGKSILNYKESDYRVLKEKFLVPEKFCSNNQCKIKNKSVNKYSISIVQALVRDDNFIYYDGELSHIFDKNNDEIKLFSKGNISRGSNHMFGEIPVELKAIIKFNKENIIIDWNCKSKYLNMIISRYNKTFLTLVVKEAQTIILKQLIKNT